MAMKRFPCTKDAPCENGMWVVADKAAGAINAPAAATDKPIGIVYTTEKEYNDIRTWGLKMFGRKIAGDYPRVGILGIGDTVTTNCLQYNESEFATEAKLWEDLGKDLSANALYVVPGVAQGSVNKAVPQLTKTKPESGIYGKVVKYYTMPNGEKGIKYQIISL